MRLFFGALVAFFLYSGDLFAADGRCEKTDVAAFASKSPKWKGRELVAFASWCSSCKSKILDAQSSPDHYTLIVAFDDVESAERVLMKLKIKSPCIYGDALVEHLGISMLPWSKKI